MLKLVIVTGLAWTVAVAAQAADQEARKVEMKGTLRTGIVAIGGETTGTIIQAKQGTFELDFGKNKELRQQVERLNGKVVLVAGTLDVRKGVEVKERRIITVTKLEEAKTD